jgi:hypothetical protein
MYDVCEIPREKGGESMTQIEGRRPPVVGLMENVRSGLLSVFTAGSLRCPRCLAEEVLAGLDTTLAAHIAVYRCPVCGHEDKVPEPVFPYEG